MWLGIKLANGDFEENIIEIEIEQDTITGMQVLGPVGMDDLGMNIKDMLSSAMPKSKKPRKMKNKAELDSLMNKEEYDKFAKESGS